MPLDLWWCGPAKPSTISRSALLKMGLVDMFTLRVDHDIELRLVEQRHVDELQALIERNLDHLRVWMPWAHEPASRKDLEAWVRLSLQRHAEGNGSYAAIWHRHEIVGTLGLDIDQRQRSAEIGYWLDKDLQGLGIITRSVRAVIGACFADLGLHRVAILCAPANVRSCAVAQRLGFIEEGTLREAERIGDRYQDLVVYGMLAADWNEVAG
jgi:ribosomal-protein-serine acetyltransferase